MAATAISGLTALTAPAVADTLIVVDDSASDNKSLALSYMVRDTGATGAVVTGAYTLTLASSGTLGLGGYTLTVPATGTAALLATANVFTANQQVSALVGINNAPTAAQQLTVMAGSTSTAALVVDTPASQTAPVQSWRYNGVARTSFYATAVTNTLELTPVDLGNNVSGPNVYIGRNSNGGAEGPSAANLYLQQADGGNTYYWTDSSGDLRTGGAPPTGSTGSPTTADTSGTVVGTQTSTLASKILLGDDLTPGEALRKILQTTVKHFKYKSNAYNGSEFHGIVADYSPEFAMDDGRVFNPVSAFGYTVQAIKALTERIAQLEGVA